MLLAHNAMPNGNDGAGENSWRKLQQIMDCGEKTFERINLLGKQIDCLIESGLIVLYQEEHSFLVQ